MTKQIINIRRVYDDPAKGAGTHFLVDRIWPRGFKKQDLHLHGWLKEVAPTTDLRHWFGHDVVRWTEFRNRYEAELDANPSAWQPILDAAQKGPVTLLFGARDEEHNQAAVLRDYLVPKLKHH